MTEAIRWLIVLTADPGESLLERSELFNHGTLLNQAQLRIPLILRFPDGALNRKRPTGLAQMVDVMPTVLASLGMSGPRGLDGANLLPAIRAGKLPPSRVILSEARAGVTPRQNGGLTLPVRTLTLSARDEQYKLVRYPTPSSPTFELFDLVKDPQEKRNLTAQETARVSGLKHWVDLYLSADKAVTPPELDDETKERLRSLGYVN